MSRTRSSLWPAFLLYAALTFLAAVKLGSTAGRPLDRPHPRPARLPAENPAIPDTLLPKAGGDNEGFAGLAPGSGPSEKIDLITPLEGRDRLLVVKKEGRKAPLIPRGTNPWEPDYYPTAKLFPSNDSPVTPINVRDPAALVMPPTP
jgi:hypothetical protein